MDTTGTWATETELFLVQYLLIRICAEWESRIPVMFERRCARITDPHLKKFATFSAQYFSKRFDITDIGKTLNRFGADYKKVFNNTVVSTNAYKAWESVYSNRKAVAHGAGVQMTFTDLLQAYTDCLLVLDAIVSSLGLTADEIKDFV
ncbi:MAG: hypothetical protein HY313_10940 [Acidobacteria bacterium]|nr:hypothetical protein [Acidobacteriota bacterium]